MFGDFPDIAINRSTIAAAQPDQNQSMLGVFFPDLEM